MANYNSSHTGAEIDSAVGRTKDTVVTAGTVAASSAVVVDANKDISGFRNVTLTGQIQAATINLTGDTTIGDGDTDNITINADVNSNIIPNTDNTFDLGSSSKQWKDIYVNGIGYIDQLGTDADPIAIYASSGEIDGTAIGSESASTGAFTTLTASSSFTLDNASGSAVIRSQSSADNTVDLTASSGGDAFIEASDTSQIKIGHASGTKLIIDTHANSGRVGIGVTSPAYALDVRTSSGTASLQVRAPNDADARIRLIADDQDDNADNFQIIHTASDNDIEFQRWNGSAWRSDLIIDSSGNSTFAGTVTFAKSTNGDYKAKIYNANAGTATESNMYITNSSSDADGLFAGVGGTGFTTAGGFVQDGAWIGSGTGASGGLSLMTRASADMRFYTNGHTNLAMVIDSSQRVGIGTTNPVSLLYLEEDNTTNVTDAASMISNSSLTINGNSSDGSDVIRMGAMSNATGDYFIEVSNSAGNAAYSLLLNPINGGKVGIGTTSPQSTVGKVDIAGSAANFNTAPMITFRDTAGNANSRNWSIGGLAVNYGDFHIGVGDTNSDYFDASSHSKFTISKDGNVGIGHTSPQYGLTMAQGTADGQKIGWEDGSNNKRGAILVNGSNDDMEFMTGTADAVRMRITDNGKTQWGTYTGNGSTAGVSLEPYGNGYLYASESTGTSAQFHLYFLNGNGNVGRIETTGSQTNYIESSDYRLKENEVLISDGLTRLNQLKPYRFNFIADADTTVDGFFAHEVAEVVPEAVSGEKDAVDENGEIIVQGLDKSKLVPLLVKALQEADDKIDALTARIEALEA